MLILIGIYILTTILQVSSLSLFFWNMKENTQIQVSFPIPDPENKYYFSPYQKEIQIYFPKVKQTPSPVAILVHGDVVDDNVLNILKNQILRQGIAVVIQKFNFSKYVLFELNATLDYLKTREDIDPTRIAVVGHSHGSHFAFLLGLIRPNDIQAVIMANFGTIKAIYNDYWIYYLIFEESLTHYTHPVYMHNYHFPLNASNPKNLLLLSSYLDPNYINYQISNNLYTLWDISKEHPLSGNFEDGTARQFYLKYSIFTHTFGLYDSGAVAIQIQWLRLCFNLNLPSSNIDIYLIQIGYFLLILISNILGIYFFFKIVSKIIQNPDLISDFLLKITRNQKIPINLNQIQIREEGIQNWIQYQHEEKIRISFQKIIFYLFFITTFIEGIRNMLTPDRALFYVPFHIMQFLDSIFQINAIIQNMLYFDALSYDVMYLWTIVIIFLVLISSITISNIEHRPGYLILINNVVILLIFIVMMGLFSYFQLHFWIGLNIISSIINIVLRFMISFIFIQITGRNYIQDLQTADKNAFQRIGKVVLLIACFNFPVLFPKIQTALIVYIYFVFYFLPFVLVIIISTIMIVKRKSLLVIALICFLIMFIKEWDFSLFLPLL